MKFARYLTETIIQIAAGQPIDKELYHDRIGVYLELIGRGMSPTTARHVMDLYM